MASASIQELRRKVKKLLSKAIAGGGTQYYRTPAADPGKLFELAVLAFHLQLARQRGAGVGAVNISKGSLNLPGAPSMADRGIHTYFTLSWPNLPTQEAWVSVEVQTLSSVLSSAVVAGRPGILASYHEIDVGIYEAGITGRPMHDKLHAGVTCKHRPFKKEQLREALGLRRETAYLPPTFQPSLASWIADPVRADPASPLMFYSSDAKCNQYARPVDALGVYVKHLRFPI